MPKYTTFEIHEILGVDRTRLQEWIDKKFITPETPAQGKGTKALFSIDQMYQIKLAAWLLKTGRKRKRAFEEADIAWEPVNRYKVIDYFIVSGDLKEVGKAEIEPEYPKKPMREDGIFRTIINLRAITREVDLAIERWELKK